MSALSIAITVSTVTFDLDTNNEKRLLSPNMWGMVPDVGRIQCYITMVLLALWQVVAKVFAIALLATTNSTWLGIWIAADFLLFYLYKIARRDFTYYVPGLRGVLKYVVSAFARTLVKLLSDVTGILLYRNSYEMGGVYFSFNTIASHAGCWVAAALYIAHFDGDVKIDDRTIYAFIGGLQTLWVLTVILFFSKIKRRFWSTFYSTASGRADAQAYFLDSEDEHVKMRIFENNEDLWSDIRDQVKAYSLNNWVRWEAEKPEWFNEAFKAGVPDYCIPKEALVALAKQHGGTRRRSSAGLIFVPAEGEQEQEANVNS